MFLPRVRAHTFLGNSAWRGLVQQNLRVESVKSLAVRRSNNVVLSRPFGTSGFRRTREEPYTPGLEAGDDRTPSRRQNAFTPLIDRLNLSFESYPSQSLILLIGLDIASIFGTYQVLQAAGFNFSSNFALAFVVSKTLRKIRLPLDVGGAALLAKLCPQLAEIKLSALFRAGQISDELKEKLEKGSSELGRGQSLALRGLRALSSTADQYGAAFFLASRFVGVASVMSIYMGLEYGLDLLPLMQRLGLSPEGDSTIGAWAAAVVCSSFMSPATVVCAGYAAPALAKMGKSV